jgi:DNA damage-binding protein 1
MYSEDRFRDVGDGFASEISAVSCTPPNSSKNFTNYIAVSFWGSNCVKLFSPESNLTVICETPSLPALPRSLLLHNFGQSTRTKDPDYHPYLLVGLTDGTVVSFAFQNKELVDQNIFSLGELPVFLSPCQVDSRKTVITCGSRASILFWERETLHHSPVILKVCWRADWDRMPFNLVIRRISWRHLDSIRQAFRRAWF